MKMKLVCTAYRPDQMPPEELPEVVILGRSNSGKSSFINRLAEGAIAQVSQAPGKTRSLNFYVFKKKYIWIDMPGYGYAARGGKEQRDWQGLIEKFLLTRTTLKAFVLLMDIRRDWSEDEEMLIDMSYTQGLPFIIILTKADKVSKSQSLKKVKEFTRDLNPTACFSTSSLNNVGFKEVEEYIYKNFIK